MPPMSTRASPLTISTTINLPNSSVEMPRLGFGVYLSPPEQCVQSCLTALNTGYRHIDTAQYYENEAEVGMAVKRWIADGKEKGEERSRSDVFLTSKILAAAGSVEKSYQRCVESVKKIDDREGGYVDLFLIHSPRAGREKREEMWRALERLLTEGKARAIGVSNYGVGNIEEMKEYAKVWPPHVNQIELHPWCQQRIIDGYCQEHGIVVEAYSPLVRNNRAGDQTLAMVATKYKKTTAQVLIRYCLQKNWVPLPKSDNPERIRQNADIYDFEIGELDMKALDDLDQGEKGAIVEAVKND